MQTNGCVRNGAEREEQNGHINGDVSVAMDRANQDIVRLIGQHLRTVGLKYVFDRLFLCFTHSVTKIFCVESK